MLEPAYDYQRRFLASELQRLFKEAYDVDALHHSLCSHMMSEVQELMDCRPWMLHKKPPAGTRYNTVAEMVDAFKWLLNIMTLHDVTEEEFWIVFEQKSRVVEDRIRTEIFTKSKPGPCLVCDIDGVLCDRDSVLLSFINRETSNSFHSVSQAKTRLGSKEYAVCKRDFYASDYFVTCPPMEDSLQQLRSASEHVPVVLLTARNVRRDANLHFLTLKWLEDQGVRYSALLFDEEKDRALHWADSLSIGIDDSPEQIERMNRVIEAREFRSASTISDAIMDVREHRRLKGCPEKPTTPKLIPSCPSLSPSSISTSTVRSWLEIEPAASRLPPGGS